MQCSVMVLGARQAGLSALQIADLLRFFFFFFKTTISKVDNGWSQNVKISNNSSRQWDAVKLLH